MGDPIKMPPAGIMDQAALYLQIKEWMVLENKVSELTRMVGEAEQARAAAEVRAEAAIHAEQVTKAELVAVQGRLQAVETAPKDVVDPPNEPSGPDPAVMAVLDRIEKGLKTKPAPLQVVEAPVQAKPRGYDVIVHRNDLGDMKNLEIIPK